MAMPASTNGMMSTEMLSREFLNLKMNFSVRPTNDTAALVSIFPSMSAASLQTEALLTPNRIDSIEVSQEGPVKIDPIRSFKEAGLHPVILENVELCEYAAPTPIQKFAIPALLQGHDVIGIAQTGTSSPSITHIIL